MQREIKFRAFYEGLMFQVTELFWSNQTAYLYEEGQDSGFIIPLHDIKLMQFTGLKSKSGTEIYEGDIVDGRRYYRPALYGRRVAKMDYQSLNDLERWCNDIEVIGNIYENPGLLTV
jgi:hypothetical protein